MKSLVAAALAVALTGCASAQMQATAPPQRSAAECGVKPMGHYMNMSVDTFDQSPEGWRAIGNDKENCEVAAADIIAAYRAKLANDLAGLLWHEAQGRALAGQTDRARDLFRQHLEYELSLTDDHRDDSNLLKSEATVAFMEGDLSRLQRARAKLAALPVPQDFAVSIAHFKANFPDRTPPSWPLNLDMVDGLIRCFGKPYAEALVCRGANSGAAPGE